MCVASSCCFNCSNQVSCSCGDAAAPGLTSLKVPAAEDDTIAQTIQNPDCALNVLCILGFVASGDGGTEAERPLGFLGLPNLTTMKSRSFGNIEREIGPGIQQCTESTNLETLQKEASLVFGEATNADGDKLHDLWLENKLTEDMWPQTDGSADMGWQQRGSSRKRNSKSGHALIIGLKTRLAVAKAICSKACDCCKSWHTERSVDLLPPEQKCFKNHDGSSSLMEPIAVLAMHKHGHSKNVIAQWFIADDDPSSKTKLKWNNAIRPHAEHHHHCVSCHHQFGWQCCSTPQPWRHSGTHAGANLHCGP